MQKHSVSYDGKTIEYTTNNTGIVSEESFGPFEAAGLTKAKLLELEHWSFSKGIVVKIGGKSVRFSHAFEAPGDRAKSSGMLPLDKFQRFMSELAPLMDDDLRAKTEDLFSEELEALKAQEARKEQEKADLVAKLEAMGLQLTAASKKALGLSA